MFHAGRRIKDGLDAVVVHLRNGIKLVVVAACAADRRAQERERGRRHQVVHGIQPIAAAFGAQAQEPRGDHRLVGLGRDFIARQLLFHKSVIRLVGVERVDEVIAVAIHLGAVHIELVAAGVGIPHQIHPVPRPAFAVVRRGQQCVDQPRPRIRRRVLHKRVGLGRCRRQAEHVQVGAAHQRATVGRCDRRQALTGHRVEQERVNRVRVPPRTVHRRHRRAHGRHVGPVGPFLVGDGAQFARAQGVHVFNRVPHRLGHRRQ